MKFWGHSAKNSRGYGPTSDFQPPWYNSLNFQGESYNCQKQPQHNCQKVIQQNCQKNSAVHLSNFFLINLYVHCHSVQLSKSSQPYCKIVKKISNDFYRKNYPYVRHGDSQKIDKKSHDKVVKLSKSFTAIQYNCQTLITCFKNVIAIQ